MTQREERARFSGTIRISSTLVTLKDGSEHADETGNGFAFVLAERPNPLTSLDLIQSDLALREVSALSLADNRTLARAARDGVAEATVVWAREIDDVVHLAKRKGSVGHIENNSPITHISITYDLIVRRMADG